MAVTGAGAGAGAGAVTVAGAGAGAVTTGSGMGGAAPCGMREAMGEPEKPTVVFLHGLGRTHRSMAGLRKAVEQAGYRTWARTYPSRRRSIDDLARTVAGWIAEELPGEPLVAVTHSLGGILVRHMPELPWRGVVMLAPPNAGSRVARALRDNGLFRWYFGPAGQQVCDATAWPLPEGVPVAVIAGTAGATVGNPTSWLSQGLMRLLPPDEPHDGTVAVCETRLPTEIAFATVPASHTWIMDHPETRAHVLALLETLDGERPLGRSGSQR